MTKEIFNESSLSSPQVILLLTSILILVFLSLSHVIYAQQNIPGVVASIGKGGANC